MFKLEWSALLDLIGSLVPPALGAFVGLRYAKDQSRVDRAVSWFCAMVAGIYVGGAVGEHFTFGPKTTVGIGFTIAMLGAELWAVAVSALRQWAQDPVGTFRKWRDAWLGRGS